MSARFQIDVRTSNGNLHVQPKGDFDGSSACELINVLRDHYDGIGRVFIDTTSLRDIGSFGCRTFQARLDSGTVPPERLFFKGEKGHQIAPSGSRVLLSPKKSGCGCNGNCSNCPCSGKKRGAEEDYRAYKPGEGDPGILMKSFATSN